MAEKGFGVKEVNLIGASGTPTITSPNNLNLNAVNVAISTNVSIGGALSVTGNVSVGGTLTYEDVTNIDSVGLITARSGVSVNSGGIQVLAGVSRFNANIIGTATTTLSITAADESSDTSCNVLFATAASGNIAPKTGTNLTFNSSNGTLTATTFSGSGASLTNLPLSNTDVQVLYTVTANGSSAYRFAGNGIVSTEDNPDVYLIRGFKYRFVNNSGGSHPFQIRQSSGGSAYSAGVTNNGASSGNIDFQVPYSAPSKLVYQCTSHGGMVGNIYIRGANGQNDNVGLTTFKDNVSIVKSSPILELSTNTAGNDASIRLHESTPGSTSNGGGMFYSGADNKLHITCGTTLTSKRITILRDDGKVGIGTDNPSFFTHIQADGVSGDVLKITARGSGQMVNIRNHSNVASIVRFSNYLGNAFWDAQLNTDNSFSLDYSDSTKFSITSGGTVSVKTGGINLENATATSSRAYSITNAAGTTGWTFGNGVTASSHQFVIYDNTAGAARLTIDSDGKMGHNKAASGCTLDVEPVNNTHAIRANGQQAGYATLLCDNRASSGTRHYISFRINNGVTGKITSTGSSTVYATSSDYRLKENVTAISDGITRLKTLKPSRFNWKADSSTTVDGFLAHEVTAVPEAIVGAKDEVDSDNNPVYQAIDEGKLVPLLTAALQEAITKIENLEAEVTALKAK